MDYDDVERKVVQGSTEIIELQAGLKKLQARVEKHSLVIKVLSEMLLAQGGIDASEFRQRLESAAAQKEQDKQCHNCGRPINLKHNRCMYCGEQRPPGLV